MINKIVIENFKCFERLEIDNIQTLNILIGKNNAGKSSVFQALKSYFDSPFSEGVSTSSDPEWKFPESYYRVRNKPVTVEIELVFNKDVIKKFLETPTFSKINWGNPFSFDLKRSIGNYSCFTCKKEFKLTSNKTKITNINWGNLSIFFKDDQDQEKYREINDITNWDTFNTGRTKLYKSWRDFILPEIQKYQNSFIIIPAVRNIEEREGINPNFMLEQLTPAGKYLKNFLLRLNKGKPEERELFKQICNTLEKITTEKLTVDSELINNLVDIIFYEANSSLQIPLSAIGTGIAELLIMISQVLYHKDKIIAIEEPEIHLHAETQKKLLSFFQERSEFSQLFIATHSPIFINQTPSEGCYLLRKDKPCLNMKNDDDVQTTLTELGMSPSDLFQSNAILFVEGVTDIDILTLWAKKLGWDFNQANINLLEIEGCRNLNYYSENKVLKENSIIETPYLFVIDHDEKSEAEIKKIQRRIPNTRVLKKREIESYLVIPEVLISFLREKADIQVQKEEIEQTIDECCEKLKSWVLIKKVKENLKGGGIAREQIEKIINQNPKVNKKNIIKSFMGAINKTYMTKTVLRSKLKDIFDKQSQKLDKRWTRNKLNLVPGKELLSEICKFYGLDLNLKRGKDTYRLAELVAEQEKIPQEISQIIKEIYDKAIAI